MSRQCMVLKIFERRALSGIGALMRSVLRVLSQVLDTRYHWPDGSPSRVGLSAPAMLPEISNLLFDHK
jgi:hypothetical protein